MKIKVECVKSADGLTRHYTGTVASGKRKGETVKASVADCGYGWHLFWEKCKRMFGANIYTA
jgi:hypothetical protein